MQQDISHQSIASYATTGKRWYCTSVCVRLYWVQDSEQCLYVCLHVFVDRVIC